MPDFKYFAAPRTEVFGYSDRERCIDCRRVAPSTLLKRSPADRRAQFCCLDCLAAGRSRIEHETEIGYADAEGLSTFDLTSLEMSAIKPPRGFPTQALEELSRTPDFQSHQGGVFLVHCNDFMRYLGRWEPEDFAGPDGRPSRDAYLAADGDSALWDATAAESEPGEADEKSKWAHGAWCYVFDCLHCGKRRCSWDCD